jgi:hypothetical protein
VEAIVILTYFTFHNHKGHAHPPLDGRSMPHYQTESTPPRMLREVRSPSYQLTESPQQCTAWRSLPLLNFLKMEQGGHLLLPMCGRLSVDYSRLFDSLLYPLLASFHGITQNLYRLLYKSDTFDGSLPSSPSFCAFILQGHSIPFQDLKS